MVDLSESPVAFAWSVDQDGYEMVEGALLPRGGSLRFYRPLDDECLWLRFAHSCIDAEGVLSFANEFGRPSGASKDADNRLENILATGALLRKIIELVEKHRRYEAMLLFNRSKHAPKMREVIFWSSDNYIEFIFLPQSLQDALFHQAGEAITGNRRFRRCQNEGCPKWFRLGARAGGSTITTRREFCSDRCRVASSRRQKRKVAPHA
jgi:hypothetical protein